GTSPPPVRMPMRLVAIACSISWRLRNDELLPFSLFALRSSYFAFLPTKQMQSTKSEVRRAKKIRSFQRAVLLNAGQQFVHRERLAQVVIDAEHLGISAMASAFVGGHHDHLRPNSVLGLQAFEHQK